MTDKTGGFNHVHLEIVFPLIVFYEQFLLAAQEKLCTGGKKNLSVINSMAV